MTLDWFKEHGCELQRPDPAMLTLIYSQTNGNPCNGCNCKPTCPAWKQMGGMTLRDKAVSPLRDARRKINTVADGYVPLFGAERVNQKRIEALNHTFQTEAQVAAKMADTLMKMPEFLEGCKAAGVEPTRRQANKCLREEGIVWQKMKELAAQK